MAAEPSVSPADTIRRLTEWSDDMAHVVQSVRMHEPTYRNPAELRRDVRALLAVGERDKAALADALHGRELARLDAENEHRILGEVLAERERDRRQIAQLTERVDTLKNGPLLGILETYRREHPDDHLVLSVVIAEIQKIAAVLAGEEDT